MRVLLNSVVCALAFLALVCDGYRVEMTAPGGEHLAESGELKDVNGHRVLVKQGEFAYKDPKDVAVQESWSADEKGFKAQGNRIPTPPPIPAAIQASLVQNRVKPPFGPGSE